MPFRPDESIGNDPFSFYNNFAKTAVLKLTDTKECSLGAQWIKFLNSHKQSPGSVVALKLLIMCVNRGRLTFPFDEPPPDDLQMFESDFKERELAHLILSATRRDMAHPMKNPPITTSLSADNSQYAAVQEIPKFGVHCYFATSDEPINKWQAPGGMQIPDLAQGNSLAWEKCMANMSACMVDKDKSCK